MNTYASAHDQILAVRDGKSSSRQLVDASLDRIGSIDSSGYELNSVLALSTDARENAEYIDATLPLAGLPILIKDNIEAVGLPGTAGSLALSRYPVERDSPIVSRLRAAGANIIGATNLSEWANIRSTKSTSGWSSVGGLTANPWKHVHSAGGSSSGSGAAISAGLVSLAVGTETDGSIVCPASLNGCVGIKPTVGSVPRMGVIPISASQDSPGSMARTVQDSALLLEVMMGASGLVNATLDGRSLKIGVVKSWLTTHEGTDALFDDVLTQLGKSGITLIDVDLQTPDESVGEDEVHVLLHELVDDLASYFSIRCDLKLSSLADVVRFNAENADTELQYFAHELFEQALALGGRGIEYAEKRARNLAWAEKTLALGLDGVDVLIGTTYSPAWVSRLGKGDDFSKSSWITTAPAIAGSPIGCLPMGITDGLPVGIGVVSRRDDEARLITAMAQIESSLALGILEPTFIK
ncbi:MAG: amidase family protein [Candidatus Nanopelagicaceae bacterium]|nr:amidase family protein [Candidatus Nanopelagicaceae bacterium]